LILFAAPMMLDGYYIGEATRVLIYAMAGLGLMVLTGFTGQASLGHAAFLAIGAYTNAWFLAQGFSSFVALPMAALLSMIGGLLVAIPAARMSGIYLAIATLAFAIIVEDFAGHLTSITGGNRGMMVDVPMLFGYQIRQSWELYLFVLSVLVVATLAVLNILRSPLGRAMIAVRDSEVSSQALGVNPMKIKVFAFTVSAAITGLAGAFLAHYMLFLTPQIFGILLSIQ
ncbi:MAG: branched-chain amino acid ABC transporter permease, partial [Alteromonas sp.]|nr:branched-chain amino acid ABC transporter permease [Alteromonas sp.]